MIKRFFSLIIAFVVSVSTFPFSFLPSKNDTEFSVNDGIYESVEEDGSIVFNVSEKTEWFNFYGLKYSTDAYVKGVITYGNGFRREISEEFFLEPAESGEFCSFIDNCLDNKKARNVVSVKVAPLDKEEFNFELLGVSVFNREIPDTEIFLSNGQYKIGVNLDWGGAMSYLEDLDSDVEAVKKDGRIYVDSNASGRYGKRAVNKHVNLINRHDTGRLVQQSYYGVKDSEIYVNGSFSDPNGKWRYNPVQGGNKYNDSSKLVDLRITETSIYIKCRPMDWAKDAASISPSYMEATYSFVKNTVQVDCRFVDFSGYEPTKTTQELPAFYCVEPLSRFVYCDADGNLAVEPDLPFWGGANKKRFTSSENWAAFTGEFEDSFGIGLYTPERNVFIPGVYERGNTVEKDPSVDNPTSYIAIAESLLFESFKPFEYSFSLTTGDTAEIRNNFKEIA